LKSLDLAGQEDSKVRLSLEQGFYSGFLVTADHRTWVIERDAESGLQVCCDWKKIARFTFFFR
jgi:hypothetical protein